MADNDQIEIELESNLNTNTKEAIEKRKTQTIDIDDNYIRQIAREDDDHPSLSPYVIPFIIVSLIAIVWSFIAVEEVIEWFNKFFKLFG